MAVESRLVPSIPTPTIPKRTRSLGGIGRPDACKGSESRKIVRAATLAPAARAVVCKNSRREKRILFINGLSFGAAYNLVLTGGVQTLFIIHFNALLRYSNVNLHSME